MDFEYDIIFCLKDREIRRSGKGVFYPHDGGFNLEHMLWLMTEEFGRPTSIKINMEFVKELAPPIPE